MINKSKNPMSNKYIQSRDMVTQGMTIDVDYSDYFMNPSNNQNDGVDDMPIGMAYVPWQCWRNLYTAEEAIKRGTLFMELDKPFYGGKGTESC